MSRPRIHALAAVVLVGAMLSIPSLPASGSAAGNVAAGNVKFVAIQTKPNHDPIIAATGVIHAQGTDVVTGNLTDRFEFPDGNVLVKHKPKKGSETETFDPVTCFFTFSEKGTWKTTGGSGAYDNVQGGGAYKVVVQGFGCEENDAPDAFYVKIVAKGNLTY